MATLAAVDPLTLTRQKAVDMLVFSDEGIGNRL